jgi:hypothetical protein
VDPFHQQLARIAFAASDDLGLVLAGGYAISAQLVPSTSARHPAAATSSSAVHPAARIAAASSALSSRCAGVSPLSG